MKTYWFAILVCMAVAPLCRAASDLDAFERNAARAKQLGATHIVITEDLPPALWEMDVPGDPYPAWYMYHPGLLKIFPPAALEKYVDRGLRGKSGGPAAGALRSAAAPGFEGRLHGQRTARAAGGVLRRSPRFARPARGPRQSLTHRPLCAVRGPAGHAGALSGGFAETAEAAARSGGFFLHHHRRGFGLMLDAGPLSRVERTDLLPAPPHGRSRGGLPHRAPRCRRADGPADQPWTWWRLRPASG